MKIEEVNEVITCLGDERRVFHYFKDRYCLDLIDIEMQRQNKEWLKISELKQGKLSRFINKPIVSEALKNCGNGRLDRHSLMTASPAQQTPFVLTLASWGEGDRGWDQTTRNQCNLVLQLNFDGGHVQKYNRYIKPNDDYGPFESWSHPVVEAKRKTLSWVRMDVDFDTGEALIEEVQSDWLRKADRAFRQIKRCRIVSPSIKPYEIIAEIQGPYKDLRHYVEHELKPYRDIWAEASLLAAIRFIREDLGISTIYYHSFDTGRKIKQVCGSPPKSIYTQLPKRFGFALGEEAPQFVRNDKYSRRCLKAIKGPMWYRLDV